MKDCCMMIDDDDDAEYLYQLSFPLYWQMCRVTDENTSDLVRTSLARERTGVNIMKNFHQLETICEDVNRILTQNQPTAEPILNSDVKSDVISKSDVVGSGLPSVSQEECKPKEDEVMESESKKESNQVLPGRREL